jgi:hypothetical protein
LTEYGIWRPYTGNDALLLALLLLVVGGVFAYLGTGLRRPVGTNPPGRALGILLVLMWGLSLLTLGIAVTIYGGALFQQAGPITVPPSPIAPVTASSGLVAFIAIAYLSRRHGLVLALGSAFVGAVAAPMLFELPFDLIVMWRTPHPAPTTQYALLFFLPLFLVEISSFSLLTLSPLARVSRFTLFSLAAVFFVFAVWALAGFSYPSSPVPFAFNVVSKVLCFVAAVTLFVPQTARTQREM